MNELRALLALLLHQPIRTLQQPMTVPLGHWNW